MTKSHILPEKHRKELSLCKKCGSCLAVCPVYEETMDETMSPRGRLAIATALSEGRLTPSDNMLDKFTTCLSCMACATSCPNRVDAVSIFSLTKKSIIESGEVLSPINLLIKYSLKNRLVFWMLRNLSPYLANIYKVMPEKGILSKLTPFLENGVKRVLPDFTAADPAQEFADSVFIKNPVAKVILFTGCMTDLTSHASTKAAVALLNANGVEVCFPKGFYCCGAPAYFNGDHETAKFLMERNMEVFKHFSSIDYVLTTCGTCGTVLKKIYPELFDDLETRWLFPKIMDIQLFLQKILKLPAKNEIAPIKTRVKVTYHDPCHLRRGQGIFKEPRELLKSIPELEYIEMKNSDSCCGGGGVFNVKHYELSSIIASHKISNIQETGAEIVVTACPLCIMQLRDMVHRAGLNIKVMHTIQLIGRYLNAGK